MTPRMSPSDILIERALGAFREIGPTGRVLPAPAWWDLSAEARETLFEAQIQSRLMEAAIDARGLSTTARAVLERTRWIEQIGSTGPGA